MAFKPIIGATGICLAVTSFNTFGASYVYDIDSNITGVAGLDIDGTIWDMTLHDGTYEDLSSVQPNNIYYAESFANSATLALLSFTNSVPDPVIGDFIGCVQAFACRLSTAYTFNGTHYDTYTDEVKPGGDSFTGLNNIYYQNNFPSTSIATWELSTVSTVPVPAAVWLFGSGLLGLVGVARRKKA